MASSPNRSVPEDTDLFVLTSSSSPSPSSDDGPFDWRSRKWREYDAALSELAKVQQEMKVVEEEIKSTHRRLSDLGRKRETLRQAVDVREAEVQRLSALVDERMVCDKDGDD